MPLHDLPLSTIASEAEPTAQWRRIGWRWVMIFLIGAIAWRLVRFFLRFPIWEDEAGVLLNFVFRPDIATALAPLENDQVAPMGFLWLCTTAIKNWGTGELALRIFPLLIGIVGSGMFCVLAWRTLEPIGAAVAVGFLLATHYVTRYSLDIKPYGTDLLASTLLLWVAVEYLRDSAKRRWLVALAIITPLAMLFSFPTVFVAGAIGIGLLPGVLRRSCRDRAMQLALLGLFAATTIGAFSLVVTLSASNQYDGSRQFMLLYWKKAFPPANPLRFIWWMLDTHTAQMLSYPFGGKNGASTLTFLLCVLGTVVLWRQKQRRLLAIFALISLLTLVAAALRRYPYGGSARVAQHMAPGICLLCGAAVAWLIHKSARPMRSAGVICGVLGIILIGGMVRDILHPYHTINHEEIRELFAGWKSDRATDSRLWVLDEPKEIAANIRWYLFANADWQQQRICWAEPSTAELAGRNEWWVLNCNKKRQIDAISLVMQNAGYQQASVVAKNIPGVPQEGRWIQLQCWKRPQPTMPGGK